MSVDRVRYLWVCYPPVIKYLQKHRQHVWVRLLDLVQQHDGVRVLEELGREDPTFFVPLQSFQFI
jgi:hypothetical protein